MSAYLEPTSTQKRSSAVKAFAVLSVALNLILAVAIGLLWSNAGMVAQELNATRNELAFYRSQAENLTGRINALTQELNITRGQLDFYRSQAEYYSALLKKETAAGEGIVGEATINVVAVRAIQQGFYGVSFEGVAMFAKIELVSGEGRVLVNTIPRVGIDLQTSARTAALVAERVTGASLEKTDVIVTIMADEPVDVVDGPSAGAAITIAMIAAIKNEPPVDTVFITGTINPDGSIGVVGGVPYKAEAAAQKGGKIFLVPSGQATVAVIETVERHPFPGWTVYESQTRLVSLEEYLHQKGYDIDVIEVGTINQAYEILTGKS